MLLIYARSISLNQNTVCCWFFFSLRGLIGLYIKVELFSFGIVLFSLRVIFENTSPFRFFFFMNWTLDLMKIKSHGIWWNGTHVWNFWYMNWADATVHGSADATVHGSADTKFHSNKKMKEKCGVCVHLNAWNVWRKSLSTANMNASFSFAHIFALPLIGTCARVCAYGFIFTIAEYMYIYDNQTRFENATRLKIKIQKKCGIQYAQLFPLLSHKVLHFSFHQHLKSFSQCNILIGCCFLSS